jgi:hypothetical protein
MAVAFLVGRFLFGGYFIYNGLNHFLSSAMLTQFAAAKGVPAPSLAVAVAGLLILFGDQHPARLAPGARHRRHRALSAGGLLPDPQLLG